MGVQLWPVGRPWVTHHHGTPVVLLLIDIAQPLVGLGWPLGRPWVSHMLIVLARGSSMDRLWFVVLGYGTLLSHPWVTHGSPMDHPQATHMSQLWSMDHPLNFYWSGL